jgi:hypothetical protein
VDSAAVNLFKIIPAGQFCQQEANGRASVRLVIQGSGRPVRPR